MTSVLHMLLGEMVPKNLALAGPERAAMLLAPLLVGFIRLFRPVIVGLTAAATAVLRLFKVDPVDEGGHAYTAEQVAGLVEEASREGLLGRTSRTTSPRPSPSASAPRPPYCSPPPGWSRCRRGSPPPRSNSGWPRPGSPAFRSPTTTGDWSATCTWADVLQRPHLRAAIGPLDRGTVRALPQVAAETELHEVLALLQRTGAHLAEVVEGSLDGGRPLGVVALKDVLEELVGEVRDATRRTGPRDPATPGRHRVPRPWHAAMRVPIFQLDTFAARRFAGDRPRGWSMNQSSMVAPCPAGHGRGVRPRRDGVVVPFKTAPGCAGLPPRR